MNSRPLIVDGLWRCLCPRFIATPRLSATPRRATLRSLNQHKVFDKISVIVSTPLSSKFSAHALVEHTTTSEHDSTGPPELKPLDQEYANQEGAVQRLDAGLVTDQDDPALENPRGSQAQNQPHLQFPSEYHEQHEQVQNESQTRPRDQQNRKTPALKPTAFSKESPLGMLLANRSLDEVPTPDLYVTLRSCAAKGLMKEVDYLARELIMERHEKPNMKLYGSLISSNVDPTSGSAEEIGVLLAELRDKGLVADTGIYHNALRVLAVHPNAILRSRILEEMRSSWMSITETGWQNIVAACVKEGHTEQALEYLDEMRRSQILVLPWLYHMFIYKLCDLGEVEQAATLLKQMITTGVTDISPSIWYYLFDTACTSLHYETLNFIWSRRVQLDRLQPSLQQCTQVLIAAARNSDAQLANDVFQVLGKRAAVFESQHYEALMEAYIGVGDLKTALTVFCIMSRSGVVPDERSTRSIHSYARQDAIRSREMLATLFELHKDGRDIPVAAVNCLLESSTGNLTLEEVVEQYKSLHQLCSQGPNIQTFNCIFRACRLAKRKDTAMFFASEMVHMGIRPNALTYDRLILVCLEDASHDDSFRYLQEMRAAEMIPRVGTMKLFIERFCETKDERVWTILSMMQELRMDAAAARSKAWLDDNWDPNTKSPSINGTEVKNIGQVATMSV